MSLTVGIVANEFFDPKLGRMGGFGFNALTAARALAGSSEISVQPVFLSGEHYVSTRPWRRTHELVTRSNGFPLLLRSSNGAWREKASALGIDLLLTIEHRQSYDALLEALPRTPFAVWIRDPRTPADLESIATLRVPGDPVPPQGIASTSSLTLAPICERARRDGRRVGFVSPAPGLLASKAASAYGLPQLEVGFLGNALDRVAAAETRTRRPSVVFLGRLDPIKRPWLFAELARRVPEADFLMIGRPHYHGVGAGRGWMRSLPGNVRLLAHVDGVRKRELLARAWVVANTSIHEALATSLVEALHAGVPLLACHDPEQIVSRFGVHVGRFDGDGLDALPAFEEGLRRLLDDDDLRERLGGLGREWARTFHTRERFVRDFAALAGELVG